MSESADLEAALKSVEFYRTQSEYRLELINSLAINGRYVHFRSSMLNRMTICRESMAIDDMKIIKSHLLTTNVNQVTCRLCSIEIYNVLKSGILWSVGATTTMPTATNSSIGINQWAVGPGFQLGYISKKAVLGWFINYQFGLGNEPQEFSLTTLQIFAVFLPTPAKLSKSF